MGRIHRTAAVLIPLLGALLLHVCITETAFAKARISKAAAEARARHEAEFHRLRGEIGLGITRVETQLTTARQAARETWNMEHRGYVLDEHLPGIRAQQEQLRAQLTLLSGHAAGRFDRNTMMRLRDRLNQTLQKEALLRGVDPPAGSMTLRERRAFTLAKRETRIEAQRSALHDGIRRLTARIAVARDAAAARPAAERPHAISSALETFGAEWRALTTQFGEYRQNWGSPRARMRYTHSLAERIRALGAAEAQLRRSVGSSTSQP